MKRIIVSRHFFRRTARKQESRLRELQIKARVYENEYAVKELDEWNVGVDDALNVEKAKRGPYRYYVVAT